MHGELAPQRFEAYRRRYAGGEWRATIFRDLVLAELARLGPGAVVVDVGCGHALDASKKGQQAVAEAAGRMIGVEPDAEIETPPWFDEVHRCLLDDAPIEPSSVDLAYSVMVLEHVSDPQSFWSKTHELLRPGGIALGFTVHGRHYFSRCSRLSERLGVKDAYLTLLSGRRGEDRYENYPVVYRSNTPEQIERVCSGFSTVRTAGLSRPGETAPYLPRVLHGPARLLDRALAALRAPGHLLVVRAVK